MLLRLLPEQVAKQWDQVWPAIEYTLPEPISPSAGTNVLQKLMSGALTCWVVVDDGELKAIMTTAMQVDLSGRKSLLIYSLFGYEKVPIKTWVGAANALRNWARGLGCIDMIAYTDNDNSPVMKLVRVLGGNTDRIVVSIPIEEQEESKWAEEDQ